LRMASTFGPALEELHALLACVDLETALRVSVDETAHMQDMVPATGLWCIALVASLLVLLFGFALVRPVNFVFGTYLGGVVMLSLLGQFARDADSCLLTVGVTAAGALGFGAVFALFRKSMYAVLGAIFGNAVGNVALAAALSSSGWSLDPALQQDVRYFFMGFCTVLGTLCLWHVGETAWVFGTAIVGSYFAVVAAISLGLPYLPDGQWLAAFVAYRPTSQDAVLSIFSSPTPALLLPLAATLVLALLGACCQLKLRSKLRAKKAPLVMR